MFGWETKVKILAVSVRIPEEGKKGDQVLSFHRLSYLSRKHTIKLVCFGSPVANAEALTKLEALGICVRLIPWNKFIAIFKLLAAMFNARMPFQCALFQSASFMGAVSCELDTFKPDAVYAVMIRALVNLPASSLPLFVDMVDSMGLNFSRRVSLERGLKRLAFNIEYQRVSAYEVSVAQHATLSYVVSKVDQNHIHHEKVKALPLGINGLEFFKQANDGLEPIIVFTGNMNYKPNVEAVLWFYDNCWTQLKLAIPAVHWVIAGSNPTAKVLALRDDEAISVTGRVASLAMVLNGARLSIAPMQSGSGMQFKILEAMACGLPVVTTSLGLGDIAAKPEQDIIVADSADAFVQSITKLLASPKLRKRIGCAGLSYVTAHHTWDALNAEFEQFTFARLKK
jgi:glycosyltransferase involved in cell wall biosynthesis